MIGGRDRLQHFMTLPAAEAMPPDLRAALDDGKGKMLDLLEAIVRFKYSEDEPRDERGRWTSDGGSDAGAVLEAALSHAGTPEDPVPCGDDIKLAARLIAEGVNVTLNQERQVSTLLDEMQKIVLEAQAQGKEAPNFDLCNVSVEGTNLFCQDSLGIERVRMPQLVGMPTPGSAADMEYPKNQFGEADLSEGFAKYLAETGREVTDTTIDASMLRASQSELNGVKVAGITDALEQGKFDPHVGAIWVTNDDYVIDGHHRWAAEVAYEHETGVPLQIPVHRIDIDIGTALTIANFWTTEQGLPGATVEDMSGAAKQLWLLEQIIRFKFDESQPRDEHGRWTSGGDGGGASSPPAPSIWPAREAPRVITSTPELEAAYRDGFHTFDDLRVAYGLSALAEVMDPDQADPNSIAEIMNIDLADPEDVTEEQVARCQEIVDEFVTDPDNQALFDRFGVPEFVVASRMIGSDDAAGDDPLESGCAAQWSNGTVFLYGDTFGDPEFAGDVLPGFNVGNADPQATMMHEYGHQVMGIVGVDDDGPSEVYNGFLRSLFGSSDLSSLSQAEMEKGIYKAAGISTYASRNPSESFAETFTAVTRPDYDRMDYPARARDTLDYMHDLVIQWEIESQARLAP